MKNRMIAMFGKFANASATWMGKPSAFVWATAATIIWAISGPLYNYSDTWQLVINTGTTVLTFLMVFLIQNTQNRDAKAIHIKLDELVKAVKGARNQVVGAEELSDKELDDLLEEYRAMHDKYVRLIKRKVSKN